MAGTDFSLEVRGLDTLADDLRAVEREAPEIARKWIQRAGRDFLKDVRAQTKAVTKKHSGRLLRGYRQKVVLKKGSLRSYESQINGGNGKARHFHLVEDGHRGKVPLRGGGTRDIGFVEGKKMMDTTRNRWTSQRKIVPFAKKAIDESLGRGGLL